MKKWRYYPYAQYKYVEIIGLISVKHLENGVLKMDLIKLYGNYIRKNMGSNPEKSWNLIRTGIAANGIRTKFMPDKKLPKGYQKLEQLVMKKTSQSFNNPDKYVWCNIFTPVEILQCFDLHVMSIESYSSFLSGLYCEDFCIDYAQNEGITPTLCSYHKGFIGAADMGLIPSPDFAVTTSLACDGNLNTFRYFGCKKDIEYKLIDVPYESDEESIKYVSNQLENLIKELEKRYDKKMDWDLLKEIIIRENESKKYLKEFIELQKYRYYPGTLTLQLFMVLATHLYIGTEEVKDLFYTMKEDIKNYPKLEGKKIFWTHVVPFYQPTLKNYFNFSEEYQIVANDMILDYMEELDPEKPLESLSKKMVNNIYNGPYENKIKFIEKMVKELDVDAVINFCHWGCKQSSGGSMILKEAMSKMQVPTLILDGDAMDRRNSHDGQIKTRLEAFLEVIDKEAE